MIWFDEITSRISAADWGCEKEGSKAFKIEWDLGSLLFH